MQGRRPLGTRLPEQRDPAMLGSLHHESVRQIGKRHLESLGTTALPGSFIVSPRASATPWIEVLSSWNRNMKFD